MAKIDLSSEQLGVNGVDIQAITTDTTTVGNEIDMLGYEGITFFLFTGTLTDGSYVLLIEDSDTSGSGYAAVSDTFLIGTEVATTLTASDSVTSIGYVGKKRYVRASIVSSATTSGGTLGTLAVQGSPLHTNV